MRLVCVCIYLDHTAALYSQCEFVHTTRCLDSVRSCRSNKYNILSFWYAAECHSEVAQLQLIVSSRMNRQRLRTFVCALCVCLCDVYVYNKICIFAALLYQAYIAHAHTHTHGIGG